MKSDRTLLQEIQRVAHDGDVSPEVRRLIANAPAMHDLLQVLVGKYATLQECYPQHSPSLVSLTAAINAARDLLRAVEGA